MNNILEYFTKDKDQSFIFAVVFRNFGTEFAFTKKKKIYICCESYCLFCFCKDEILRNVVGLLNGTK